MSININLHSIMSKKKISLIELAENVGITNIKLMSIQNNDIKSIKLSTLAAICKELECQPGEILSYSEI